MIHKNILFHQIKSPNTMDEEIEGRNDRTHKIDDGISVFYDDFEI